MYYNLGIKLRGYDTLSPEIFSTLGKTGFYKMGLSKKYNFNFSLFKDHLHQIENFNKGLMDFEIGFSTVIHLLSVIYPLSIYGNTYIKKIYLQKAIEGEWIGAHCMTEPEAGSDISKISSKLENGLLTAQKIFISNVSNASFFLIYSKNIPGNNSLMNQNLSCYVVDTQNVERKELNSIFQKMSWGTLFLNKEIDVKKETLGREGKGFEIFTTTMMLERIGLSFFHLGLMKGILEQLNNDFSKQQLQNKSAYMHIVQKVFESEGVCQYAITKILDKKQILLWSCLSKQTTSINLISILENAFEFYHTMNSRNLLIENMLPVALSSLTYSGTSNTLLKNIASLNH